MRVIESCAVRPQKGTRAVSKFEGAVGMMITTEDSKRCSTAYESERLKTVN